MKREQENALILATLVKTLIAYFKDMQNEGTREWYARQLGYIEGRLAAVLPLAESLTDLSTSGLDCKCGHHFTVDEAVARLTCACGAIWERGQLDGWQLVTDMSAQPETDNLACECGFHHMGLARTQLQLVCGKCQTWWERDAHGAWALTTPPADDPPPHRGGYARPDCDCTGCDMVRRQAAIATGRTERGL
jgi:hypothetical protein